MRVDRALGRTRGLVIAFLSLTLILGITTVAPAHQDMIFTYSDDTYAVPETTFDDGDTVYVEVTDNVTKLTGALVISVTNVQEANSISVSVTEGATYIYRGSFTITSGADGFEILHMEHGQTATISADLDGEGDGATKNITADYGITPLQDNIWTYSDSTYIVEETEFGDGDTVYVKVTDTETKSGTKAITVQNDHKGNIISVDVTDSNSDSFYLGHFIVHSQANDDVNDKLGLFYGETATISADLANDGLAGTVIISFRAISPPTNLTATAIVGGSIRLSWTASSPETNVSQYNIYRATTSGEQNYASPLANVSAGTIIYTDSAASDGVTYYYVVRAQDGAGNIETNTNEAIATADATPPPSPSGLTAAPISGDGVQLTWTASSPEADVSQYNIYRATSSGAQDFSSPTYTVSIGITSYTDSSATLGQAYYYVVRAQDATGNTDSNTNEAWTTAGFAFSVDQVYTRYQDSLLCNLTSSTDRQDPTAFTNGKIDEIYLKVNLLGSASLNESSSSIALYRLVDSETEEVLGSQQVNQGTGWAELSFHLDSEFDPDLDQHSRDGLYWVDITVEDTAANSQDYDFYFIYDTTSPSIPNFNISSFDPIVGYITVSGTTVPDELSDPQEVEIFVNGSSQGTVAADANYRFVKSNMALTSGTNRIQVQSTDRAGNKSELSESLKLDYNPGGLTVFRSAHVVKSGSSIDIIYSVAQPAEVTIRMFNLLGEIVKEWQGSVSSDIENRWTWYGRNMYEQEVNNGVYICRISATDSSGFSQEKIKLLAVVR